MLHKILRLAVHESKAFLLDSPPEKEDTVENGGGGSLIRKLGLLGMVPASLWTSCVTSDKFLPLSEL